VPVRVVSGYVLVGNKIECNNMHGERIKNFIFTSKESIPTALNSVINLHTAAVVHLVSQGMVCVVLPGLCLPGKGTQSMSEDRVLTVQILLPH